MSWSWVRHGVRPSAPVACASLGSFASAMSIGGHWPWDSVIIYRLFICEGYHCTLLSVVIKWDSILVEHVVFIGSTLLSIIIRGEYLSRARGVYQLYIIIEYYQIR